MFWRRYRSALAWSVPQGAALGILLSVAVYLTGNPDYRRLGGWSAFFHSVMAGTVFGSATALGAALGAVVVLLLWDRGLRKSAPSRRLVGALGGALGASFLWLCFGIINGFVSTSGWSSFGFTGLFIAVSAPIAAFASSWAIERAERRATGKGTSVALNRPGS